MVETLLLDLSLRSSSRKTFDCCKKCSVDSLGTLLIIGATKIELSRQFFCIQPCTVSRQLFEMLIQLLVIFSSVLLNIYRDIVSIVVTLFLLIAFSFVATILELTQHYALPTLAK